jgi:MFS family permease
MKTAMMQERLPRSELPTRGAAFLIIGGALLALMLGVMDQSIVATAGPTIIAELGGLNLYAWVFSAFILAQTVSMLIFGRLSDIYGRKRLFLAGLATFLIGSMLSGASQTIIELIAFRALQGIGSGAFFSIGLAIIGAAVQPAQRARVLGIAGSIFGTGAILGPTVGSYLIQAAGWRWIFYVNLPLGLASLIIVSFKLREHANQRTEKKIDWTGTITLTAWVSLLLLGFLNGGSTFPWYSWQEALLFGGFVLFLFSFLVIESRVEAPTLPLSLFRNRTISALFTVNFVRGAILLGLVAFISLLVQGALGGSIEDTRNVIYAFVVPFVLGSIVSGQVVARIGFRVVTIIGAVVILVGTSLLILAGPSASVLDLMERSVVTGLGLGVSIASVLSGFQNSVERKQIGVASSLAFFSLNLGGAICVGILGSLQVNSFASRLSNILQQTPSTSKTQLAQLFANPNQVGRVLTSPSFLAQITNTFPALTTFIPQIRAALGASITDAFLFLLIMSIIAVAASLFVRDTRENK